jgi:hypothetical protein
VSLFKKVTNQGGVLVVRDENDRVISRAAPTPARKPIESWRSQLRRINNGGMDTLLEIVNIANGQPFRTKKPDGDEWSDWQVPTTAERLNALQFLAEFQLGKSVSQNDIIKAEEQAEDHAQYAAMSDEALAEAARPYLERVRKEIVTISAGKAEEPE